MKHFHSLRVKNEPRRAGSKLINQNHCLILRVSDLDFDNIQGQIKDAISFLRTWELELVKLIALNDNIEACLDFPLYSRFDKDIIVQNDHLPKELIILAGRIGLSIEMSIYDKYVFSDSD
ncbi:MAG: hypothetical protein KGO49_02510 [Gammaproteobacteria bacterium]|nr:hypothetical protein [Gammaproteobacteria bacterium]